MPNRKNRKHRMSDNKPPRRKLIAKTEDQERLIDAIDFNDVIFCVGPAGTGKTAITVAKAVEYLMDPDINISKILITRPLIECGGSIGFLPGSADDKIHPYLIPVLDELDMYLNIEKRKQLRREGSIEVCPLEFMRGRNFHSTVMILDESQNATRKQIKNFLTRVGCNSVALLNGDESQTDLPDHLAGGLTEARLKLKDIEGFENVEMTESSIVRSEVAKKVIKYL